MASTKLISPGIPNYTLKRNLKLNGNYISNDGGDEGISIDDAGNVSIGITGADNELHIRRTDAGAVGADPDAGESHADALLTLEDADNCALQLLSGSAEGVSQEQNVFFGSTNDPNVGYVKYTHVSAGNSADLMEFGVAINTRMVIDASGNVGIGTDDPDAPLDIKADVVDFIHFDRTANGGVSNVYKISVGSSDMMGIGRDGSEDLFITSSGNVGLGTPYANKKMTISGADASGDLGLVTLDANNTITSGVELGRISFGGDDPTDNTFQYGAAIAAEAEGAWDTNDVPAKLVFYTADDGTNTLDARMTILENGNVGIGEAAPQDTLEVNGTVLVKDALKFTQDDGNEFIDSQNDGYLDIGATTAIRLEQDTLIEGAKKLYFNDAGGEYISGDGTDLAIVSGGSTTITSSTVTGKALTINSHSLGNAGGNLVLDINDSLTTSATKSLAFIDYDKSGVTASGQLSNTTALDIAMNDTATNDANGFINMIGARITIDSANAQGSIIQTGLILSVAADSVGDAGYTTGLATTVMDGGIDIKLQSSADTSDYCSIATTTAGATTIATVDSDDGEEAHLTFDIQGDTIFKGDIANGTSTEVARIDASKSSLLMASGKKIEFGAPEEYISGDTANLTITSGGNLNIDATGQVEFDGCGVGFDLETPTYMLLILMLIL